jgi:hypothetical protein
MPHAARPGVASIRQLRWQYGCVPRTWIGLTAEGDRVSLGSSLTHRTVVACTQFTMQPPPFSPLMIIGWHSSQVG